MQRVTSKHKKPKFICQYCGLQYEAETHLMFSHMRTRHPEQWVQIQAEIEAEKRKAKIDNNQQMHDEQCIKCPRCGGAGKLFINQKGQERIPGEDYVQRQ